MPITKKPKQAEEEVAKKKAGAPKASWLLNPKKAAAAFDQEEKEQEEKKSDLKLFRFFMKGGEGPIEISFVDGNLDDDGVLECPIFREHRLHINGSWNNYFVCTQDEEPCPICEGGDDPTLVAAFTIIQHTPYVSQKKKTYADVKKLLIVKRHTYKELQKLATEHGGLAGCTFNVSRTNDDAAAVGDVWEFVEKHPLDVLAKHYDKADWTPADYDHEIEYQSAKELRAQGFGIGNAPSDAAFHDSPSDAADGAQKGVQAGDL